MRKQGAIVLGVGGDNARDEQERAPIHMAVKAGYQEVAQSLIDATIVAATLGAAARARAEAASNHASMWDSHLSLAIKLWLRMF